MGENDNHKSQTSGSFKERILAELEEANRIRKQREAELEEANRLKQLRELEAQAAAEETARLLEAYEKQQALEREAQEERAAITRQMAEQKERLEEKFNQIKKREVLEKEAHDALEKIKIAPSRETTPLSPNFDPVPQPFVSEDSDLTSDMLTPVFSDEPIEEPIELIQTQNLGDLLALTENNNDSNETLLMANQEEVETSEYQDDTITPTGLSDRAKSRQDTTGSLAKRISRILMTIIIVALLVTGFFAYRYVTSALNPVDKTSTDYVQVEIPAGSGNKLIGQILEKSGVVKSGTIFNYYTKFHNYSNFQSGYYNLQQSMSLDEIAKALQEGGTAEPTRPPLGKVLIPEGYTIDQMAKAITDNVNTKKTTDKTPFKEKAFLSLMKNQTFITKMVKKYPQLLGSLPDEGEVKYLLEGYLFPATYDYYDETSLEDLVDQMLATTDSQLSPYYDTITASGKTVNEILTLASLVEKEGATDDDRKMIASVFYNRLDQNMPLQSNIAILYAMGKLGQKTTLAEDASIDTAIDSPYNIYKNPGLMPGPVDNPGLSAIKATVNPSKTSYLYFVADVKTGNVYYADTYEQHEENVEKYVNSQLTTHS